MNRYSLKNRIHLLLIMSLFFFGINTSLFSGVTVRSIDLLDTTKPKNQLYLGYQVLALTNFQSIAIFPLGAGMEYDIDNSRISIDFYSNYSANLTQSPQSSHKYFGEEIGFKLFFKSNKGFYFRPALYAEFDFYETEKIDYERNVLIRQGTSKLSIIPSIGLGRRIKMKNRLFNMGIGGYLISSGNDIGIVPAISLGYLFKIK
jgi:hypothetical protein